MGVQARDKTVQLGCDALGRPCACAIPAEQDRSKVALTDLDTMLEDAELRDVKQAFWKRCRMRFPAEVRTSCYPAFLESFFRAHTLRPPASSVRAWRFASRHLRLDSGLPNNITSPDRDRVCHPRASNILCRLCQSTPSFRHWGLAGSTVSSAFRVSGLLTGS